MGLERYVATDEGFRKYVELMETTPTGKRQKFLELAKAENPLFTETAVKYLLTFERITKLQEGELAEVLGAEGLKPEVIANAIGSVDDPQVKENMIRVVPRKIMAAVQLQLRDFPVPKPNDAGAARLQLIQTARALERDGKLKSVAIPRFGDGHFVRSAA